MQKWHAGRVSALTLHPYDATARLRVRWRLRWSAHLNTLALALAVAGGGCPAGTGSQERTLHALTTNDVEAERALREAAARASSGQHEEAARLFLAFLERFPRDPLAPLAILGLGKSELELGRAEAALARFDSLVSHEDPGLAADAHLYRGVALHRLGRDHEAVAELAPRVRAMVDPTSTLLLLRTLGEAARRLGDSPAALEALDALVAASDDPEEKAEATARIREVVADITDPPLLLRAYDDLARTGAAWPIVAERAVRDAYRAGEMDRVRSILEAQRAQGIRLDAELGEIALRASRPDQADPQMVGVILSLSGRGRGVGESALRGLMLAAGLPPTEPLPPDAPQLIFRDDGGDPAQAVRAVEDLVSLHRVVAIIGPFSGATAVAAARRAQELGVPLLALSGAEELATIGPMVFRFFPSAADEARSLVAEAHGRGARTFAILHPNAAHGEAYREAFARAVTEAGDTVSATVTYEANATAFTEPMAALAASRFDALIIADGPSRLALLSPALAAAGIWSMGAERSARSGAGTRRAWFLVPSVAADPTVLRTAGRYLQGALFATPFDATASSGPTRVFVDRFRVQFSVAPTTFSAYAHDAYRLVRRAVDAGSQTREALSRALESTSSPDSVTAAGGLSARRTPRVESRILEVRGNELVAVPAR